MCIYLGEEIGVKFCVPVDLEGKGRNQSLVEEVRKWVEFGCMEGENNCMNRNVFC